MSRNGSGTYSLPVNSWNPSVNAVSATAADWQTLIDDVETALTGSLAADGQTPLTGNLAMGSNKLTGLSAGTAAGNSLRWEQLFSQGVEADIASATTTDIGAQNTNFLQITGTTTITGLGTNYNGPRFLRFAGALTLTHNSATLALPGAANITTAAGDRAIAIPKATAGTPDGWIVYYQKASGLPVSTTGLVPAGAVTSSGLTMATARMLGRTTGGTGAIEELTAAAVATFADAVTLTGTQTVAGVKTFSSMPVVPAQSIVRVNTANGYGSTNTKVPRFTTTALSQGTDITYADSAANGASFTINVTGVYSCTFVDNNAGSYVGMTLAASSGLTDLTALGAGEALSIGVVQTWGSATWCGYLAAGSVIKPHSNGAATTTASQRQMTVARVG